jgi:sugar lactone lactonase YvrE
MKIKAASMMKRHAPTAAVWTAALLLATASHATTIYVSNSGDNTIEQYTDGVGAVFAHTGLSFPEGLAMDSAGNLFVSNRGNNTIMKFTPGGVGSVFASTGLNAPMGLVFDSAGNLFVANIAGGTIMKFTPSGVGSLFATVGMPAGLAFDKAGNLFATTVGFTITRFTPDGVGTLWATAGRAPGGLAFDVAGNLYTGNGDDNTVGEFTPAGVGSIFANTLMSGPLGVAFDPAGNLYVANNHNNTVTKYTSAGVGSVFANTGLSVPTFIMVAPENHPPVAVIEVSPLAHFPGYHELIVIAPDGVSAKVTLDGSKSHDPDGNSLTYSWSEGGSVFSTSPVVTESLSVGSHTVSLSVNDGFPQGTNSASVTVEVISPAQAVGILIDLIDNSELPRNRKQPLIASLEAAVKSFDRERMQQGAHDLMVFQKKVLVQVGPPHQALGRELISAAQVIIAAVTGQ